MQRELGGARLSRRTLLKAGLAATGAAAWTRGEATPAAPLRSVPRSRTLVLAWRGREGRWVDHELWNPYALGANHQNGAGLLYEPLAYYSALADKEYLWLVRGYQYGRGFRELTMKTRSGIRWSDGTHFSAEDVAYTLTTLRDLGPRVRWGIDVQQVVEDARAVDPTTVVVRFKVPAPRFFSFMTYKFDIGVYIVPKHVFQGQDWTTFDHFDPARGWPVTTSPWRVALASPEQKVLDRRDDWWAARAGLAPMPRVERVVWLPWIGEQQSAQALIADELDSTMSLQSTTLPTIFRKNPRIVTHTGHELPHGYMDWWPYSLYVNNERPPLDDAEIRWALSYCIDRNQIAEVSFLGAAEPSPLPMPSYPGLRPYIDSVKDLLAKHDTLAYNPAKAAEILTRKGWTRGSAGLWVNAVGATFRLDITGFGTLGPAVGPVITEQLRRQGIDATFSLPPDFEDRFQKGLYTAALYGHGGSVNDPYATLRLYQSASVAIPGGHLVNFSRWKNETYDRIVDEVAVTDTGNRARLVELFRRAMEIWLPALPDIPLTYNYHRIPMNTTYWQNWPTAEHPYANGAFWHLTYAIVLWNLQPTR